MTAVRSALQEREWLWSGVALVVLAVVLRKFTDLTAVGTGLVLGVFVAAVAFEWAVDAGVVSERLGSVGHTLAPFLVAGYLLVGVGDVQSATIAVAPGVRHGVGTVRTALRSDTDDEQGPDTPTTRRVRAALDQRPRTRRELWDAVDAEADAVDDALDRLHECGAVERVGSEYRIATDRDSGLRARLRALVAGRGAGRRVDDTGSDYETRLSPVASATDSAEWGHAGRGTGGSDDARADGESRKQAHERQPEATE